MPGGLFWKGQNRRQRDGPRGFCNTLKKKGADSVTHRQGSGIGEMPKVRKEENLVTGWPRRKKMGKDSEFVP